MQNLQCNMQQHANRLLDMGDFFQLYLCLYIKNNWIWHFNAEQCDKLKCKLEFCMLKLNLWLQSIFVQQNKDESNKWQYYNQDIVYKKEFPYHCLLYCVFFKLKLHQIYFKNIICNL